MRSPEIARRLSRSSVTRTSSAFRPGSSSVAVIREEDGSSHISTLNMMSAMFLIDVEHNYRGLNITSP